MVNIQPLRDSV